MVPAVYDQTLFDIPVREALFRAAVNKSSSMVS
jgi:hypothetical protein